jgi:hypothetical protein
MERPNEESRKQIENDIKLLDYEDIKKLDYGLIDFSKSTSTWLPEIDENKKRIIREIVNPVATSEKVNDKLEFITINRPEPKKEILRIPSISSNRGEPFITVENPKSREEIITIHRSKKKTIQQ